MASYYRPRLHARTVLRFLCERYLLVENVQRLTCGMNSLAVSFDGDGAALIVRFCRHGDSFAKDEFCQRFATSLLPIPRILERGLLREGIHYAVSERAPGE